MVHYFVHMFAYRFVRCCVSLCTPSSSHSGSRGDNERHGDRDENFVDLTNCTNNIFHDTEIRMWAITMEENQL